MPHRTLLYARSEASPAAARLVVVPVLTAERKSVRLAFVF